MRKNKKDFQIWYFLLGLLLSLPVWAQETQTNSTETSTPEPPVKLSMNALVDTCYSFNFTNAVHGLNGNGNLGYFPYNPPNYSGEGDYSYLLNLAELSFGMKQGEGSLHLSIIGGQIANYLSSLTNPTFTKDSLFILEAYASYHTQDCNFSFGRMRTHMGFEVLESNEDWNYTRSLLFTDTLPRFHDGLSVNYTSPGDKFEITGYVYNGWNDAPFSVPVNSGRTFGLKFVGNPSPDFKIILNGITGPMSGVGPPPPNDDMFANSVYEGIVILKAAENFSVALDGEFLSQNPIGSGTNEGWGEALYGHYHFIHDWAVALRLEDVKFNGGMYIPYFILPPVANDEGREITLTLEHNFTKKFLARLEGRYDYALMGGTALTPGNGPFSGSDPNQITLTAGIVLGF